MPMPARITPGANWASLVANVMAPYFAQAATIQIIDPESATTTPYDPVTDTGGVPVSLIVWTGKAIIQKVRRPATGSNQSGWTAANPFSFQLPASTPSLFIRKGMLIRVLAGGDDTALTELSFVVTVGLSGSWQPVRILEAVAEMVSVFPQPPHAGGTPLAPTLGYVEDPLNPGYFLP